MTLDPKQKKYLYIVGGVVLAVFLIKQYLNSLPKAKPFDSEDNNELNMDLVLSKGSGGAEVIELQKILKKEYNAELGTSGINGDGIDGDFGTKTETALKNAKGVTQITLKEMIKTK